MSANLNRNDAIVPNSFLAFPLIALDHTDHATRQNAACEGRLVHQNEYIDRVSVVGLCGRDETEIIGKSHSRGKYFLKFEDAFFRVEGKFVPTALGCPDDDAEFSVVIDIEAFKDCRSVQSFFLHGSPFLRVYQRRSLFYGF